MPESEVKYTTRQKMIKQGALLIGSALAEIFILSNILVSISGGFTHPPEFGGIPSDLLSDGINLFARYPYLAVPLGAGRIAAGILTDPSAPIRSKDALKAQLCLAGAGLGAIACAAGVIGTAETLGHDNTVAGLWLATIPISAGVTRFMWQGAKRALHR